MRGWFHRLHEWATREPVARVDDPVLGELVMQDSAWECTVSSASGPIILRVGGRYEPDPGLIETARSTCREIDCFIDRVTSYLRHEAQQAAWSQFAAELTSLTVHDINYWWPRQPHAGMVFFAGPDACRLWHCDIDGESFSGLAFDT